LIDAGVTLHLVNFDVVSAINAQLLTQQSACFRLNLNGVRERSQRIRQLYPEGIHLGSTAQLGFCLPLLN
jgi:hypothetical protein